MVSKPRLCPARSPAQQAQGPLGAPRLVTRKVGVVMGS